MENKQKKFDIMKLLRSDTDITRLLILFVIVFATMSLLKPSIFLTGSYIKSMLYLCPEYGILAFAMMLAMISGGIDLSIVATANLSGILSCMFMIAIMPENASTAVSVGILLLAVCLALLIGAVCGSVNGFLIGRLGIPPMLATLGSSDLIMGLAIAITKGNSITGIPKIITSIVNYNFFGAIPFTLVVFIICALVVSFILLKTVFGFRLQMMGSNQTASKFSGIKNSAVIMRSYITSGMIAAVSGLLMCGKSSSVRANFGTSYVTQALIICVMGGTNPNGGKGKVSGIVLSVFILQMLSSGFNMFPKMSNFYRDLIWGAVLILVMAYNHISTVMAEKKLVQKSLEQDTKSEN